MSEYLWKGAASFSADIGRIYVAKVAMILQAVDHSQPIKDTAKRGVSVAELKRVIDALPLEANAVSAVAGRLAQLTPYSTGAAAGPAGNEILTYGCPQGLHDFCDQAQIANYVQYR